MLSDFIHERNKKRQIVTGDSSSVDALNTTLKMSYSLVLISMMVSLFLLYSFVKTLMKCYKNDKISGSSVVLWLLGALFFGPFVMIPALIFGASC